MKKLKIITILLIGVFFNNQIYALEPNIIYQNGIYSNKLKGAETFYGKLGYINIDGKIAYCLEPYKLIGSGYNVSPSYQNKFSSADIKYFTLLSYYGYNTTNHNNVYYYMATQELIWRRITNQEVYWTTQNATKGERINIESYKNEISKNVANHDIMPSFVGKEVKGNFRDIITLNDTNGVLKHYNIKNNTPNIVRKEGNKLYIKLMSSKYQKINLERKYSSSNNTTFYESSSGQALASFALNRTYSFSIPLQAINKYSMKLKVNFRDVETNREINGNIKFKIKNLDNDNYIENAKIFETDDKGHFMSDFYVEEGNYKIEVVEVPPNYVLNEGTYFQIIEDPNIEVKEVDDYLKQAKGQIEIERTFDMKEINNKVIKVPNVIYEIYAKEDIFDENNEIVYEKNSLIEEIVTNQVGKAITNLLPLGEYYVKERIDDEQIISDKQIHNIKLSYKDNQTDLIKEELKIETKPKNFDFNLHVKENNITCVNDKCSNKKSDLKDIEYGIYAEEDIYVNGEKIINKGQLIIKEKTGNDGNIKKQIPLLNGNYIVKELTDMSKYEEIFTNIKFNTTEKSSLNVNVIKTKRSVKKYSNILLNTDNKYIKKYFFCLISVVFGILGLIYVHKNN